MVGDQHALVILVPQDADDLSHIDIPVINEGFVVAGELAAHVAEVNVADAPRAGETANMIVDVATGHFLKGAQAQFQTIAG
ncbi:hypothetical protein D3C72_2200630 [compost metagenome]